MAPDIHTLSGAYALNAVEPDEREAFERHLAECEGCREEVRALQGALVSLADSLSEPPPDALRARVRGQVGRTPQLPPLTAREPSTPSNVTPLRRRRVAVLAAAAAVVVALLGIGAAVRFTHDDQGPDRALTAAEVFGAEDAKKSDIPLPGGEVHVAVSHDLGVLAVDGKDMPPAAGGRVYQLWLLTDNGPTSLAVMEDDVTSTVEKLPKEGQLAVTTEPHGGSTAPTMPAILVIDAADL